MVLSLFFLRTASLDEARIEAHVANVISVEHVGEEAVESETVATMRKRAVLSLIQVPVVGRRIDAVLLEALGEMLVVDASHRTADNLAYVWQQQVDRLGQSCILLVSLHVERLDLGRELHQEYRLVDLVGHLALWGFRNVLLNVYSVD